MDITRQALAITIKPHKRKMTVMSMIDIVPLLQSSKVIQHKIIILKEKCL